MSEVEAAQLILAHGLNHVTGKRVLYIGLADDAMRQIDAGTVIHRPLDGSAPGDKPIVGMEHWELVLLGPGRLPAFISAMELGHFQEEER